jgi:uncharacterized membrane protein
MVSNRIPREAHQAAAPINVGAVERMISAFGGAGLAAYGLSRGSWTGLGLAALGGSLLYRGFSGHCMAYQALGVNTAEHGERERSVIHNGVKVDRSIVIGRPADELYRLWRDLERLPTFMRHLKSVDELDQRRSHWVASGPMGMRVEWDAEVFNERDGELIAWRSLEDSDIATAGSVRFERVPGGTRIRVQLSYEVLGSRAATAIATMFGESPESQVAEDLRRFKAYAESPAFAESYRPKMAK